MKPHFPPLSSNLFRYNKAYNLNKITSMLSTCSRGVSGETLVSLLLSLSSMQRRLQIFSASCWEQFWVSAEGLITPGAFLRLEAEDEKGFLLHQGKYYAFLLLPWRNRWEHTCLIVSQITNIKRFVHIRALLSADINYKYSPALLTKEIQPIGPPLWSKIKYCNNHYIFYYSLSKRSILMTLVIG